MTGTCLSPVPLLLSGYLVERKRQFFSNVFSATDMHGGSHFKTAYTFAGSWEDWGLHGDYLRGFLSHLGFTPLRALYPLPSAP